MLPRFAVRGAVVPALVLSTALAAPAGASAQTGPAGTSLLRAREWSGTLSVEVSGGASFSGSVGRTIDSRRLTIRRQCSGPVRLSGGDGSWSGTATLSCSISDGHEHRITPSHGQAQVITSQTTGNHKETVGASLWIDAEAGTYTLSVPAPYIPVTTRSTVTGMGTSTETTTDQVYGTDPRSHLVEDRPLGAGALGGTLVEQLPAHPGFGDGTVTRTISWSLAPGHREDEVRVAIDGPACGCMHAEEGEGKPLRFTATASRGGGAFSAFVVDAEGQAPRVIANQGGATPRLELAATRETGRVRLGVVYTHQGREFSAEHVVSFCAIDSLALAGTGDVGFDGGSPGRAELAPSTRAWLNGADASARVRWWLDDAGEGTRRVPEEATGAAVTLAYEGLPAANDGFGPKGLRANVQGEGCDCVRTREVRLFFAPFAANHPTPPADERLRDAPNWFYYWRQTTAGKGVDLAAVDYVAHLAATNDAGDVPQGRYDDATDRILIAPTVVTQACAARVPPGTQVEAPAPGSELIDCFAETLRHEQQHRVESHAWWPRAAGERPSMNPVFDPDLDGVPTSVELARPGCSATSKRSCSERPFAVALDRELDAYRVGWAWVVGSADREDWACGGRQWTGGACPK